MTLARSHRWAIRVGLGLAGSGAVGASSSAFAHLKPKVPVAAGGSSYTLSFEVEHGCAGSPTVKVAMQLPDGVTNGAPVAPEGWSGSIDANVVTFVGGPQPDDQPFTMTVTMTLPNRPGETLKFPAVQTCEVGETRWIGDESSETPAPLVMLSNAVAGPPGTTASPITSPALPAPTTGPTAPATTVRTPQTTAPATAISAGVTATPTGSTREYRPWTLPIMLFGGLMALGGVWFVSRRRS
jgi:periplasmic copper chaperone A